jgi:hypothetical protein
VHADRAADPADGQEQLDEVGLGRQQLGELVHHQQQARQRREGLALLAAPVVLGDVG